MRFTYLIPIPPKEILRPDVHIRVFYPVLNVFVSLVLPVLLPEAVGIDAGDEEARDGDVEGKFAPEVYSYRVQDVSWVYGGFSCRSGRG